MPNRRYFKSRGPRKRGPRGRGYKLHEQDICRISYVCMSQKGYLTAPFVTPPIICFCATM